MFLWATLATVVISYPATRKIIGSATDYQLTTFGPTFANYCASCHQSHLLPSLLPNSMTSSIFKYCYCHAVKVITSCCCGDLLHLCSVLLDSAQFFDNTDTQMECSQRPYVMRC